MKILLLAEKFDFAPYERKEVTHHYARLFGRTSEGERVEAMLYNEDAVALNRDFDNLTGEGREFRDMKFSVELDGHRGNSRPRVVDGVTIPSRKVFQVDNRGYRVLTGPAQELHRARFAGAGASETAAKFVEAGDFKAAYETLAAFVHPLSRYDVPRASDMEGPSDERLDDAPTEEVLQASVSDVAGPVVEPLAGLDSNASVETQSDKSNDAEIFPLGTEITLPIEPNGAGDLPDGVRATLESADGKSDASETSVESRTEFVRAEEREETASSPPEPTEVVADEILTAEAQVAEPEIEASFAPPADSVVENPAPTMDDPDEAVPNEIHAEVAERDALDMAFPNVDAASEVPAVPDIASAEKTEVAREPQPVSEEAPSVVDSSIASVEPVRSAIGMTRTGIGLSRPAGGLQRPSGVVQRPGVPGRVVSLPFVARPAIPVSTASAAAFPPFAKSTASRTQERSSVLPAESPEKSAARDYGMSGHAQAPKPGPDPLDAVPVRAVSVGRGSMARTMATVPDTAPAPAAQPPSAPARSPVRGGMTTQRPLPAPTSNRSAYAPRAPGR